MATDCARADVAPAEIDTWHCTWSFSKWGTYCTCEHMIDMNNIRVEERERMKRLTKDVSIVCNIGRARF